MISEDRLAAMETRRRAWEASDELGELGREKHALIAEVRRLRAGVEWLAQMVHQAHHGCSGVCAHWKDGRPTRTVCDCDPGKTWADCRRGTCPSVRHVLGDGT